MKTIIILSISLIRANLFTDGGVLFMSLILLCLLVALFLIAKGFISLNKSRALPEKTIKLISDVSLLGLVIGFLGSILGMISGFDVIESMDNLNSSMLASGLKVSFLTTLFGSFTFAVARFGILILRWVSKEN